MRNMQWVETGICTILVHMELVKMERSLVVSVKVGSLNFFPF